VKYKEKSKKQIHEYKSEIKLLKENKEKEIKQKEKEITESYKGDKTDESSTFNEFVKQSMDKEHD